MKKKYVWGLGLLFVWFCSLGLNAQQAEQGEQRTWRPEKKMWYDYNHDGVLDVLTAKETSVIVPPDNIPEGVIDLFGDYRYWRELKSEAGEISCLGWIDGVYYLNLTEAFGAGWAQDESLTEYNLRSDLQQNEWDYMLMEERLTQFVRGWSEQLVFKDELIYKDVCFELGLWPTEKWYDGEYFCDVNGYRLATIRIDDGLSSSGLPVRDYHFHDTDRDGNIDLFIYEGQQGMLCRTDGMGGLDTIQTLPVPMGVHNDGVMYRLVEVDINLDGRMDYYFFGEDRRHYLLMQQSDGLFFKTELQVVTDEALIGDAIFGLNSGYGNKFVKPGINFSGVALADGDYGVSVAFENISLVIDLNQDGYPDLIDTKAGGAFISLGNGRYYPAAFNGQVEIRDLNGDFIPDIILFDPEDGSITLKISSGTEYVTKELMNNQYLTGFYCRDFDKDGDVDILLTMDYNQRNQYSFLIFFTNEGNGNFKKKERSFTNKYHFTDCIDLDNNGSYAILAKEGEEYAEAYQLVKLIYDTSYNITATTLTPHLLHSHLLMDYNHDGKTEFFFRDNDSGDNILWGDEVISAGTNTRPQRMAQPTFVVDTENGFLRVEWQPGTDKETSPCDLTYALRVGTSSGSGDVFYAYAGRDGVRLCPGEGNVGYNTFKMFSTGSWPKGDYHIAVQAVDANGLASEWSEESIYQHTLFGSEFLMDRNVISTGDTLVLKLVSQYDPAFTYTYQPGADGRIVWQEKGECHIIYTSKGEKTLSLVVSDGTEERMTRRTVEVYTITAPVEKNEILASGRVLFFDLDLDGIPEALMDGVYANDGKGHFARLGRTYNLDISVMDGIVGDFNRDGWPDFIGEIVKNTRTYQVLLNEEGLDFSPLTVPFTFVNGTEEFTPDTFYKDVFFDFDNDGLLDYCTRWFSPAGFYRNLGGNRFQYMPMEGIDSFMGISHIIDVNRDGYADFFDYTDVRRAALYLNKGNFKWERRSLPVLLGSSEINVTDVNNDGYVDLLCIMPDSKLTRIYWGSADFSYQKYSDVKGLLSPIGVDLDNNGIIDLIDDHLNLYYWQPNGSFWVEAYDKVMNAHGVTPNISMKWADVNKDGVPDLSAGLNRSHITNERPATPTGVYAIPSQEGMLLCWDASTDKETPQHMLRYNVSLKKKGATGEGAYLLSPLNDTRNEAMPLESGMESGMIRRTTNYRQSTRMMMPLDCFEAGQEYELCVQAIDLWNAASPFSEKYLFTVGSLMNLDMPTESGEGLAVHIRYIGTETGTPVWDWDGGVAQQKGDDYEVIWNVPGLKNVICTLNGKQTEQTILIRRKPDLNMSLPEKVLGGCPITCLLPKLFTDLSQRVYLRTSSTEIHIEHLLGEQQAVVTFPSVDGSYWIEAVCEDEIFGESVQRVQTQVVSSNFQPEISLVSVDAGTGKNRINWKPIGDVVDFSLFTNVRIYKETGGTNHFELLGEAEIDKGYFVDMQSVPSVRKNRYMITLGTVYGMESAPSEIHGSIHLMINKGLGNSLNLMWNAYEGGVVEQYTLLRGDTPDNLSVLATLSGYEQSYTDLTVPGGTYYYALRYENLVQPVPFTRQVRNAADGHSNVVCSDDAYSVTFVSSLTLHTVEEKAELNDEQLKLHLYAVAAPVSATFGEVQWQILEGQELASISADGTLVFNGRSGAGIIRVQAMAKDGSGISAAMDIPVIATGLEGLEQTSPVKIYYNMSTRNLHVTGVTMASLLQICSMSGTVVHTDRIQTDCILPMTTLSSGIYIVRLGGQCTKIWVK